MRFTPDVTVYHENTSRIARKLSIVEPEKPRIDRSDSAFTLSDRGSCFQANCFVPSMVNIKTDLYQVKPEQVYLHRIAAEFVMHLCVLDAIVNGLEILR